MGKRKNRSKQTNGTSLAAEKAKGLPSAKNDRKEDPWELIEKKTSVKSAHDVFAKEAVAEEPKVKHYEMFKNKKKRICDGVAAERVDAHRHEKGVKRRNEDEPVAGKRKRRVVEDEETSENVLTDIMTKKAKDNGNVSKGSTNKAKKLEMKKKTVTMAAEVDESCYVVEEPDDSTAAKNKKEKKTSFAKRNGVRVANLFDDMDDEDSFDFGKVLNDSGDEVEVEDEEIEDETDAEDEEIEDEFDGLDDEDIEEEDVDENVMRIDPSDIDQIIEDEDEPYGSPYSSCEDENELEDEELSDEEHGDCDSCCSEVSEQDAASDGEGNLGEDRTAGVVKQGNRSIPLNFDAFPFNDEDSTVTASRALGWMINNCDVQTFFNDFYQQNCLVVKRNHPEYYGNLFSTKKFSELLEKNWVDYGTNINVAEYKNSVRVTLNGSGRAYPRQIKAHIRKGRSVQLVNPQAFDDHIWYLCEVLQEIFGCFVGANTYLTPAGSAGFAPHWDDIDAFLLQIEGKKYWKVYAPQNDDDELPRESSGNFTEADMKKRKPTFEGWLEAGDLLYIPRGFIHQARTDKDVHSLHVTVSTGRQWSFADLMDKLVPEAITSLASQRMKMRRGLPIGMLDMNGVADYKYRMDEYFTDKIVVPLDRHMSMLRNYISDNCLESAVDIMAREFMKTALPPFLTSEERKFSIIGGKGEDLLNGNPIQFHDHIYIRFMRRHGQRLIYETEDECFIAHRYNNSRLYEGREEQTIDIPLGCVSSVTLLLEHYPEWTKVGELTDLHPEDRRQLCQTLYDNGLLLAKTIPMNKKNKKK